MNGRWFIDCNDSKLLINKLNAFFMAHQALSQDLSGAKPLGICKITTSGKNPLSLKNHTQTTIDGSKSIRKYTQSRKDSKEISY